jgi:hypothetical protein
MMRALDGESVKSDTCAEQWVRSLIRYTESGRRRMKANETTFQHVIEGTKQYIVPLFQRPYCWDKSQWETLWNDLVDMQDVGCPRSHFIDSIESP